MEEKERFEYAIHYILDTETNEYLALEEVIDLLNHQNKRIKELENLNQKNQDYYWSEINKLDELYNKDLVERLEEVEQLKQSQKQLAIENYELKEEKLYSDLLFTRLQYIHQQANECKEEKERFGVSENMAVDSIWRVFDLQKHKCCEYEELSELENGIQSIAEDNLLRSIEHDLQFKPTRTEDEIFEEIQKINDQLKELKDNTK